MESFTKREEEKRHGQADHRRPGRAVWKREGVQLTPLYISPPSQPSGRESLSSRRRCRCRQAQPEDPMGYYNIADMLSQLIAKGVKVKT